MRLVFVGLVALAAGAASSPSGAAGPACRAAAVHYRAVPSPRGVAGVPWVASTNAAFRGYLFYWGGTRWARSRARDVRIFTAKAHVRVHPKVLWVALRRSSGTLVIRGRRLDGAGSFTARYPAAIGGGQFPSYVTVPSAGCWRVTVRSGSLHGSVTFAASDSA
jgi:hypothetical protein